MAVHENRFRVGRGGERPTIIVIHTSEGEGDATALANFFAMAGTEVDKATGSVYGSSYHCCCDFDRLIDLVNENDTAKANGGVNNRSLSIGIAGFGNTIDWSRWLDSPGGNAAAGKAAGWARRFGIPVTKLTPEQVRDRVSGFCGHGDVSVFFPQSLGHTDPGPRFPWPAFLAAVSGAQTATRGGTTVRTKPASFPGDGEPGAPADIVTAWQQLYISHGVIGDTPENHDGFWGDGMTNATFRLQHSWGWDDADGKAGQHTFLHLTTEPYQRCGQ
jgi:hypothetical protein